MIRRCCQERGPCPPRARKDGHTRRFTVIHGATGSALDLCSRRSAGRGHLLCKQVIKTDEVEVAHRWRPPSERGEGAKALGKRACPF
jgi:hypothetical protein